MGFGANQSGRRCDHALAFPNAFSSTVSVIGFIANKRF